MFKFIMFGLLFAAGLVISCAAPATKAPPEQPTAAETAPAAATPTAMPIERATGAPLERPTAAETATGTNLPLPPDVLAIYHKGGGFAGIAETLTVHQGGLIELKGRGNNNSKSLKLDEPMLQPVRRMLESQEFADLEPAYRASGADLFTYSISARDRNGNIKTVVTMDGANHPDFLGQLIAIFDQMRGLLN